MKHYPKKRRFYFEHDGRRYREHREMSPAWVRRARRYSRARGIGIKGIFRRVDLSEAHILIAEVKRGSSPSPTMGRRRWSARVPPRRRLRGTWVEVTS